MRTSLGAPGGFAGHGLRGALLRCETLTLQTLGIGGASKQAPEHERDRESERPRRHLRTPRQALAEWLDGRPLGQCRHRRSPETFHRVQRYRDIEKLGRVLVALEAKEEEAVADRVA